MASLGDMRVVVAPTDEFRGLIEGARIQGDVIDKVNAGAALTFALYYAAPDLIKALPVPVVNALIRAQHAYGIGVGDA